MKKRFQSYFTFTRTEKAGVLALLLLLCLLITVRLTMPYWYKPATIVSGQQLGLIKNSQLDTAQSTIEGVHDATDTLQGSKHTGEQSVLFYFDPNTVDSLQLSRLGFSTFQTRNLIKWRSKGKRFYKPQDFRPLYGMTGEQYNRLAPYIRIDIQATLKKIDLNRADSFELLSIRGIGPKIAHRILERRREKGPYTNHSQLLDVYHFSDSMYQMLQKQLIITP